MRVGFFPMWPSMGCLPWAVTSFFSFSRFPFVLLFPNTYIYSRWTKAFIFAVSTSYLNFFSFFILCVCVCVLCYNSPLYLKLPPNVGVQKSVAVSDATGKVLDIGTRHSPRILRSFVSACWSFGLSAPCKLYRRLSFVSFFLALANTKLIRVLINIPKCDKKLISVINFLYVVPAGFVAVEEIHISNMVCLMPEIKSQKHIKLYWYI